jgi:BirA family transcriptional regulator, biotin operon repressor / biotin---[acetyl-CoA-carboxylase] ligase
MPEPLPAEYQAALRQSAARRGTFGSTIHYASEIGSTNDEAARLAEGGAAEGTTVVASAQTSGRGRLGRTWFSPPGAGLYVSVICRSPKVVPYLTLAGGVAVAEGIRAATGLPVEIKWPNDVVVGGGPTRVRKLAGVLAEASSGSEGVQYVVLGFGINLRPAAYPSEIYDRATSLEAELGREADAPLVLADSLCFLAEWIGAIERTGPAALLDRWRALSPSAHGHRVQWESVTGAKEGRTAGLGDDGALLVSAAGQVERIISGTVRWL